MKSGQVLRYAIAGIAAFALISIVGRSCSIGDKYSRLSGEFSAYKQTAAEDQARLLALVEVKELEIQEATATITTILDLHGQPSAAEQEKDRQIKQLSAQVRELKSQGDLAGALAESEAACSLWAEKFTLAEEQHRAEIVSLNAAWQTKFDAQFEISESWKKRYENERRLRGLAETMNAMSEARTRTLQVTGSVKTVALLVVIGAAGFLTVAAAAAGK